MCVFVCVCVCIIPTKTISQDGREKTVMLQAKYCIANILTLPALMHDRDTDIYRERLQSIKV